MHAVLEQCFAKIYDQTKFQSTHPQIGEQLRLKNHIVLCCRLTLYDYQITDEQINASGISQHLSFLIHGEQHLSPHLHPLLTKLIHQGLFIDTFKQAGATQGPVRLQGTINDNLAQLIFFLHSLCVFAPLR